MGTWGTGIKSNDTSSEVYDCFYALYDGGNEISDIIKDIENKFEFELKNEDTKNNVIFALALCLWETKSDDKRYFELSKKIIESGADIKVWEELDADKANIRRRKKALENFLNKITVERSAAKKRRKMPVPVDTDYRPGLCMCFRYNNECYGAVIIINSEFYEREGTMTLVLTDIRQREKPTKENILNSQLICDIKYREPILHGISYMYSGKREAEKFFWKINEMFENVCLLSIANKMYSVTWQDRELICQLDSLYKSRYNRERMLSDILMWL